MADWSDRRLPWPLNRAARRWRERRWRREYERCARDQLAGHTVTPHYVSGAWETATNCTNVQWGTSTTATDQDLYRRWEGPGVVSTSSTATYTVAFDTQLLYERAPVPPITATELVTGAALLNAVDPQGLLEAVVGRLGEHLTEEITEAWQDRGGIDLSDGAWLTWVRDASQPATEFSAYEDGPDFPVDGVEVGVTYLADPDSRARTWQRWAEEGVAHTLAPGRPRLPTPEEVAEAEEAAARERERRERLEADRREAAERAEELLRSHLTDEQRASWDTNESFDVRARSRRRYRIERGYQGNVLLLDRHGRPERRYCIHALHHVPEADQRLSQKLLLEADETRFLEVANGSAA